MSDDFNSKLAKFLRQLPEGFAYASVALLIIDTLVARAFTRSPLIDDTSRLTIIAAFLAALALSFHAHRRQLEIMFASSQKEHFGVEELIPSSTSLDLEDIFKSAKEIRILTLAGSKLARLGDQTILQELGRVGSQKKVVILLANPRADSIRRRYECDEPPEYETGIEGIERRLRALHALRQAMPYAQRKRFEVRVFDCYPTCSIVQSDNEVYSTIYGYRLRGADCPKVHAKVGGRYAEFLRTHFDKVYDDARPLENWIAENPIRKKQLNGSHI